MSQVKVQLLNPGGSDVSVGIDTTLVVATAGQVTQASLEDTSGEAYGLLIGGVAVVPAGVSLDELAAFCNAVGVTTETQSTPEPDPQLAPDEPQPEPDATEPEPEPQPEPDPPAAG